MNEGRWCISEPTLELRHAVITLNTAGDLVADGDLQAARDLIDAIDEVPLRLRWAGKDGWKSSNEDIRFRKGIAGGRASPPSIRERRALYEADGWHCRYCQVEVIDPEARKRLVELLNPFGSPLWGKTDISRHAALLNLSASYDHVEPNSETGNASKNNLVTACWYCQFGKMAAPLSMLGLQNPSLRPPLHASLRNILSKCSDDLLFMLLRDHVLECVWKDQMKQSLPL